MCLPPLIASIVCLFFDVSIDQAERGHSYKSAYNRREYIIR